MVWKKEFNTLSKYPSNYDIKESNNLFYSEAMHMILSADSPDSEDLNDQKYNCVTLLIL